MTLNNKFYNQIVGAGLGYPLGPALGNVFMCGFEKNDSNIDPIVWSLYPSDQITRYRRCHRR